MAGQARNTTGRLRHPASVEQPPPLVMSDGSLEALKWLGLVLMTLDHVNKYLFHHSLPFVFEAGRTVMPIFGFVLAYNLARPTARASGAYQRVMKRLAMAGLMATPPFMLLNGPWTLNILFTLLLFTATVYFAQGDRLIDRFFAVGLVLFGGALVEFCWPGLLCCLTAWRYCSKPSGLRFGFWVLATASLGLVNGNGWALAAIPLIQSADGLRVHFSRNRAFFYLYYPAHLMLLLAPSLVLPAR